jgi:hypothetical protein
MQELNISRTPFAILNVFLALGVLIIGILVVVYAGVFQNDTFYANSGAL